MVHGRSGAARRGWISLLGVVLATATGCRDTQPTSPPSPAPDEPEPAATSEVVREGVLELGVGCGCMRVEDGRVWCSAIEAVPDGEGYVAQASAAERIWIIEDTLCVRSEGRVRCFAPEDPFTPPLPSDAEGFVITPAGREVHDVAWGTSQQCVVDGEGTPWCRWLSWQDETELPPLQPYPLADVDAIEFGDDLGCMRTSGGAIHCLFESFVALTGELDPALGSTLADVCQGVRTPICEQLGARVDWPAPFLVLERSRDFAVGSAFACLVDERGTVGCLSVDALPNEPIFGGTHDFATVTGMPPIVQIDASSSHVCALAEQGEVWCFGNDDHGQLGDGTTTTNIETTPVLAGRWPDALQVSVGFGHSCVRTPSETHCWGWVNEFATTGIAPMAIPDLRASELRAFEDTTCANTTDGWRCWGGPLDSLGGLLGAARLRTAHDPRGPSHDCSLDGTTLRCDTSFGQSELPGVIDAEANLVGFCALREREVACVSAFDLTEPGFEVPEAEQVFGNEWQGCVLDRKGKAHCWKDPTHALFVPNLDVPLTALAFGEHSCGLDRKGAVRCWTLPDTKPLPLPPIVELVDASSLDCARDERGGVWCWGHSFLLEQPIPPTAPEAIAVPPSVQLVAGIDHVCSRSEAGEVHCWGDESSAQLGRVGPQFSLRPTPVSQFTPH